MTREAYPRDQLVEVEIDDLTDEEVEQVHEGTSDLKTASQSNTMIVVTPYRWKKTNQLVFISYHFEGSKRIAARRIFSKGTWQTFIP
jgi:hypothetical protein